MVTSLIFSFGIGFIVLNIYVLIKLWLYPFFNRNQKLINTLLCFFVPVVWTIIVLVIVHPKKRIFIMTKKKRRIKKGTDGSALHN